MNLGLKIKEPIVCRSINSSLGRLYGCGYVYCVILIQYNICPLQQRQLFRSGIEILNNNTLILAFTGSAFITLLVFIFTKFSLISYLVVNYMAIEIAQGVCGIWHCTYCSCSLGCCIHTNRQTLFMEKRKKKQESA